MYIARVLNIVTPLMALVPTLLVGVIPTEATGMPALDRDVFHAVSARRVERSGRRAAQRSASHGLGKKYGNGSKEIRNRNR
jgi:hypothetical protein